MKPLQAVILAAGNSRRFPTNKLLKPLPAGNCLLDISVQLARTLTPNVTMVINQNAQLQQHCQVQHYHYLINSQSDTGMASSITCGVVASADAAGWAIFLADMPCISSDTLQLLTQHWPEHEVIQPTYQQQPGHPVIFSHSWFEQLTNLSGDQGARELLRDNPQVFRLETNDPGVCFDIDTEADWETYLRMRQKYSE